MRLFSIVALVFEWDFRVELIWGGKGVNLLRVLGICGC